MARHACKACGFIRDGDDDGKPCPACGAPASAFTPYRVVMGENRYRLLQAHLHPIATHFPGSFSVLAVLVFFLAPVVPSIAGISTGHGGLLGVLVALLPWFVALTFVAGMVDGKARFGKVSTPHLSKKILVGVLYLAFSILAATFHVASAVGSIPAFVVLEGTMLVAGLGVNGVLGKTGGSLTCCSLPRGREGARDAT